MTGARPWVMTGWANPWTSTAVALPMNSSVITANASRPRCPNQVSPATTASSASPSTIRSGASEGTYEISALTAAATEIVIVRMKSTISAPIGTNTHPVPNARAAASAEPPPSGNRATSCQ